MTTGIKNIDQLMKQRALKHSELEDIGREIAESAKPTVISFIDLADSTAMKEAKNDEEWLGIVFEFLKRLSMHVENAKGTVVKRIGDEVLATFVSTEDSENFLHRLKTDKVFDRYKYRISLDYGNAYHFQFVEGHPDDPYGTVVDRCARISKLGKPGTAVCTYDYFSSLKDSSQYLAMGDFPLKGLKKSVAIYLQSLTTIDSKTYLDPLLESANKDRSKFDGFKQQGRFLTEANILTFDGHGARPFIAGELLNLPRCPLTAKQLLDKRKRATDKDEFDARYVGYTVRWSLYFVSYTIQRGYIFVGAKLNSTGLFQLVSMLLPKEALEGLKALNESQEIEVRAVIESLSNGDITLNYVEIGLL